MIYRIYPTKDTWITNFPTDRIRRTGSNVGAAESLEVFKAAGVSGAIGSFASASLGRILMQFGSDQLYAASGSGMVPGSPRFYLHLSHKTHANTLPYGFDLFVHPVSSSWDEGRGRDDLGLLDFGAANWERRTATSYWTNQGGDFLAGPSGSSHFDTGEEDLEVDVTSLVNSWVTGGTPNNGLLVKLTGTVEADTDFTDVYTKRFYSRTSNFEDRRPYLEARYSDFVKDDRGNMSWYRTGSLVLYNLVGGQYTNLTGNQFIVRIADASGTLLTLTASFSGRTGIYSASFALPTGSYSGSVFYDLWGSGSYSFLTGAFIFGGQSATTDPDPRALQARVRNLVNEYTPDDDVRFDVSFRERTGRVPFVQSASLDNNGVVIAERSWYAVENDSTRQRVIPFDTGSDDATRLSYDGDGNFFRFRMANLHAGNVYRIIFLVEERGVRQVIDPSALFKVV